MITREDAGEPRSIAPPASIESDAHPASTRTVIRAVREEPGRSGRKARGLHRYPAPQPSTRSPPAARKYPKSSPAPGSPSPKVRVVGRRGAYANQPKVDTRDCTVPTTSPAPTRATTSPPDTTHADTGRLLTPRRMIPLLLTRSRDGRAAPSVTAEVRSTKHLAVPLPDRIGGFPGGAAGADASGL
ncbi:hypothetical protein AC792_12380 [Arthrobacter sp. RIT-PI-e]|uniref:hypothetical protein n=1 Tax=Arthrobacter sp. RIT-PI-e TaxID=1681197 RepID=UPI000675C3C6|nr:hypothetical protein [Arthrobacter sp. RIT-PI-e]KNC18421.1 hypothetical protein AC792_12380 [Arthrobacter sp. RIT-PI-e]